MGEYDRILKENIETILLALSEKLLGFAVHNPIPLTEKLQTTIEREPDFLKKVTLEDGKEIILHLEFQTTDEPDMVYRMAEYRAIMQRKYELPLRQYVIYLGTGKPKMRTQLREEEWITGFNLKNVHDIPVNQMLKSDVPEEIILAILSDYPLADADRVIGMIIRKLQQVSPNKAALKKSLVQLTTLSRIRNLGKTTEKEIKDMPITYDINSNHLYQRGMRVGTQLGEAKGLEKGIQLEREKIEQEKRLMVEEMLKDNTLSIDKIARFAMVTEEFVLEVKKELEG